MYDMPHPCHRTGQQSRAIAARFQGMVNIAWVLIEIGQDTTTLRRLLRCQATYAHTCLYIQGWDVSHFTQGLGTHLA